MANIFSGWIFPARPQSPRAITSIMIVGPTRARVAFIFKAASTWFNLSISMAAVNSIKLDNTRMAAMARTCLSGRKKNMASPPVIFYAAGGQNRSRPEGGMSEIESIHEITLCYPLYCSLHYGPG
ncbi:highly conserved protein containing a thioredoxin domain [Moorella thermoacetica Y72]|uniref:Highly conserved protein containing a thioredoxin domain n=1 Tax=Moorella thermoacetica Y72 TaxID=1325331 RepID=A0A0S6UCH7_NEOTH|nr:highly conserved protein containing a thioredoxin domain [Moorella thermoacetica Y72]